MPAQIRQRARRLKVRSPRVDLALDISALPLGNILMMKTIAHFALLSVGLLLTTGCAQLSMERPLSVATPVERSGGTLAFDMERYPSFHPLRRAAEAVAQSDARQLEEAERRDALGMRDPAPLLDQDLIAIGYASITAQRSSDAAQQRLMAARASRLDAYRNLAEQVYGLTVLAETSVNNDLLRDDRLRAQLMGFISGAELVAMEPLGNDTYQTTLRLSAAQVASLRAQVR